jgi:pseudouridine-5'-phosphate glycosidase
VDARFDTPGSLAEVLQAHWALGLGGAIVANPIPAEDELPPDEIEEAIRRALTEADAGDIHGKAVTPFLLERLRAITEGRSLAANVALVMHNARVGAAHAVALSS